MSQDDSQYQDAQTQSVGDHSESSVSLLVSLLRSNPRHHDANKDLAFTEEIGRALEVLGRLKDVPGRGFFAVAWASIKQSPAVCDVAFDVAGREGF